MISTPTYFLSTIAFYPTFFSCLVLECTFFSPLSSHMKNLSESKQRRFMYRNINENEVRRKHVSPYRIQHVLVESESRLHRRCNKGAWSRISLALSMECFLISLSKLHFLDTLKHSSCNRLALSLSYFFLSADPYPLPVSRE